MNKGLLSLPKDVLKYILAYVVMAHQIYVCQWPRSYLLVSVNTENIGNYTYSKYYDNSQVAPFVHELSRIHPKFRKILKESSKWIFGSSWYFDSSFFVPQKKFERFIRLNCP